MAIDKKLFDYLKEYKNFNDFYETYLQNNPMAYFNYDIIFRDWTEDVYEDIKEYQKWHEYLKDVIGQEGYELLLELLDVPASMN